MPSSIHCFKEFQLLLGPGFIAGHTPICESFIDLGCPCLDVRVTRKVKAVALHGVYVRAVAKERPDVGCEPDRHARNPPTLCVVVDRGNLHLDLVRVREVNAVGPARTPWLQSLPVKLVHDCLRFEILNCNAEVIQSSFSFLKSVRKFFPNPRKQLVSASRISGRPKCLW